LKDPRHRQSIGTADLFGVSLWMLYISRQPVVDLPTIFYSREGITNDSEIPDE
jgi:hypothetical protein